MIFPYNAVTKNIFLGNADPVTVYPYDTKIWYVYGRSDDFVFCDEGIESYFPLGDYTTSTPNIFQFMSGYDCIGGLSVVKSNLSDGHLTIVYSPATTTVPYISSSIEMIGFGVLIFFATIFLVLKLIKD